MNEGYNGRQFITEFPDKGWTKNISRLLLKLIKFGTERGHVSRQCNA